MDKRIVYTRHKDGGVSICAPTDPIMSALCNGGFCVWNEQPHGFIDRQIASMVNRGVNEDVAHRYAKAIMFGGCTTAEALEIIRDRDCAHLGTAIELWDASEVPTDRWFRDAWSRSHNGGPISVDLKKAKPIQFRKIHDYVAEENKRRLAGFELKPLMEIDMDAMRQRIIRTRDEIELRNIWVG